MLLRASRFFSRLAPRYFINANPTTRLKHHADTVLTNMWMGSRPDISHAFHAHDVWYSRESDFVKDIPAFAEGQNYFMRWRGEIMIAVAGDYDFKTRSDDGSLLYVAATLSFLLSPIRSWQVVLCLRCFLVFFQNFKLLPPSFSYIDGQLVVDNDGLHGMKDATGTATMAVPGYHDIVIAFFENGGGAGLEVSWRKTGVELFEPLRSEDCRANLPGQLARGQWVVGRSVGRSALPCRLSTPSPLRPLDSEPQDVTRTR